MINFLKKAKSRITSTEIQKIYTKNLRRQKTQHRRGKMVGFFIGLFVGAFIGITVMCLCTAAGQADKYENRTGKDK